MELNSARSKTMLWASIMSDNEVLITNFLASGRWDYKTFASILTTFHTTSVFHAAIGKGKNRGMHYESVVKLILNTPKGFWLSGPPPLRETLKDAMAFGKMTSVYPFSSAIGRGAGAEAGLRIGDAPGMKSRDLLVLKKRLGGFYILYTLFFKQPHAFANQIHMDAKDYVEVEHFEAALQQVFPKNNGIWKAYAFMLMRLKLNNAFAPESEEDKRDLDHPTRYFLNSKGDIHVELLKVSKEIQDELTHHQSVRAAKIKLTEYARAKGGLENSGGTNMAGGLPELKPGFKAELRLTTSLMMLDIKKVLSWIKDIGDVPVLSRSALLGNETTERLLISETGKRKARLLNKERKTASAQRYDRDIFGSQRMSNEAEDDEQELKKNTRRGRSQAATNLWSHYIPEQFDFFQPEPEPPAPL